MTHSVRNHRILSAGGRTVLLCGLILIALWGQVANARDCPLELPVNTAERNSLLPDNKLFTVKLAGQSRQVLLHWDDVPAGAEIAGETPRPVRQLIDGVQAYLQSLEGHGFRIPPGAHHPCVTEKLLRIYVYQVAPGKRLGGFSSGSRLEVTFSESSAAQGMIYEHTMPALQRELFRLVQAQYRIGAMDRQWLSEGTAALVLGHLDASIGFPASGRTNDCGRPEPAGSLTPLFMPVSRLEDIADDCHAAVFWRHFAEKLNAERSEPDAGVGIFHELYEFLESYRGSASWRTAATDRIHGTGDFDGDGREELLLTSETHLGMLASTDVESRVLAVKSFGSRISGDWHLKATDQILGIGDFNADGRDDFLVRNGGFTALIGIASDGRLRVLASMPLGTAVFSDWRPTFGDQLMAIGDYDGDGADEAMFRGGTRVGVVRLDRSGQFVSPMSTSFGSLARLLDRHPAAINIVGVGDLDGNGSDEIIARDERGLFAWGLDAQARPLPMFELDYGQAVSDNWLLSPDDLFLGVHDLDGTVNDQEDNPGLRAEVIVTGDSGLGIIGMNAFSRELETKVAPGVETELSRGFVYDSNTRVIAVGNLLASIGNQIVLRTGDTLTVLEYSYQDPNSGVLRKVASLVTAPGLLAAMPQLRQQRLGKRGLKGQFNVVDSSFVSDVTGAVIAALSGSDSTYLIARGASGLLHMKVGETQDAAGFVETRLLLGPQNIDGQYQKSLIDAVDAFVRLKDPSQTVASIWRDAVVAPESD